MEIKDKEFKINKYITLRLEEKKKLIYTLGELFRECKRLIINITSDEIHKFDGINSIDEIAETNRDYLIDNELLRELDDDFEEIYDTHEISPETEFWGHCSNLQVWVENNYDTRILRSNLAFPLLKKLTELGDLTAKKIFKEEIAKRFLSGFIPTQIFLIEGKYLSFLNDEELDPIWNSLSPNSYRKLAETLMKVNNRYLIKYIINYQTLYTRLLNIGRGELLLRLVQYSKPEYLKSLFNNPKSKLINRIVQAFKWQEAKRKWNFYVKLGFLILKISKDSSEVIKEMVMRVLNSNDRFALMVILKLRWIELLDGKDLQKVLNNTKIKFIEKISGVVRENLTDPFMNLNRFAYDLEYFVGLLLKIYDLDKKSWTTFYDEIAVLHKEFLEFLDKVIKHAGKNLMYEPEEIKEKAIKLKKGW